MRPIRTTNVPGAVAEELRRQIVGGEMNEGDRLPGNRELAAAFGVSLGSVREAISTLSSEGLIETRAGRGTFVARGVNAKTDGALANPATDVLQRKQVEELIEAREILELQLVGLAAQRASESQLERLRTIVERMDRAVSHPARYSEADVEFHLAVAEAAGNRVLYDAMANIRSWLKREMELSAEVGARRHGDLQFSVDSHRRVVDLIEAGDAEGAQAELFDIMGRHHEFVLSLYAVPEQRREATNPNGRKGD